MKPSFIMIHHTAVSYDKNDDQFKASNNYHKAQWHFKSSLGFYLGYNYEIAKNGKISKARVEGERTAACYQANMNDGRCIHIALDGNFEIEKPQPSQIYALRDLLKQLAKDFDIKKNNIIFHRDYAPKPCPGSNLEIEFVRSLVYPEAVQETNNVIIGIKQQIIKALQDLLALVRKL